MVVRKSLSFDHFAPVPEANKYLRDQHGHLNYPPNPGNFFELPAGNGATTQLACNKGATKWWATSEGSTDIRQGEYPCPGYPTSQFHVSSFRTSIEVAMTDPTPFGVTECVLNIYSSFAQIDLISLLFL